MKSRTIIISIVYGVCCQLVMCLSRDYILDDDVISDDESHSEDDQFSNVGQNDVEVTKNEKRARLSLNGELRSLADMVYHARRQGERSAQHSALLQLGKRSWRHPFFDFGKLGFKASENKKLPQYSTVTRRRSQQLSVSGPLSALANMLENEGRRRQQMESLHNRMMLLQTGKRSGDDLHLDDVELNENNSFDSDYV